MFQKFMNKKDFHPGSKWNIKRVWMAEQKRTSEEQRETDLAEQYKKEQDKFENRQMISKDEKLKLGLSFIYDVPPGFKDEKDKERESTESKEEEVKFEWLKGAPKEAYAKDLNLETHAQPFGIPVRNVRCIRCHKWGHVNTDRECPLRNTTVSTEPSQLADATVSDPLKLMQDMRSDGLALKQSVLGRVLNKDDPNQQYLASDDDDHDDDDDNELDPELAFLATLNEKQKRKLLRKLNKLENKDRVKKKKGHSSDSEQETKRKPKHKKTKKKKYKSDSSENESNSELSSSRDKERVSDSVKRKRVESNKYANIRQKDKDGEDKDFKVRYHGHEKRKASSDSDYNGTSRKSTRKTKEKYNDVKYERT